MILLPSLKTKSECSGIHQDLPLDRIYAQSAGPPFILRCVQYGHNAYRLRPL
jgi:hypothetical protein